MNFITNKFPISCKLLKFSITISLMLLASIAMAQSPAIIELEGKCDFTPQKTQIQFLIDKDGSMDIEDIIKSDTEIKFQTPSQEILNFSKTRSTIWIKLQFIHKDKEKKYLEISNPTIEHLDVFNSSKLIYSAGYAHAYGERSIQSPFYYIELNHDSIAQTLYIKVKSNFSLQVPLRICNTKSIIQKNHFNDLFFGIYFGVMIFAFLYNLFVFVSTRIRSYLYYALFCMFIALGFGSLTGYAFEIWPDFPIMNHLMPLYLILCNVFVHLFSIHFLETKKYAPFFHKVLGFNLALLALAAVFTCFDYYWGSLLMQLLSVYSVFALIITAFTVWIRGNSAVQFFLLSYTQLFVFVLVYLLFVNKLLPFKVNFIYHYSLYVSSMIQALLLSLALVDRIKYLQKQNREKDAEIIAQLQNNEEIRIKANRELEDNVAERTALLTQQSDLIEKKNKKITDSIVYASKIQQAMLPSPATISSIIQKYFIINRPKDIVSGDFFWFMHIKRYIYVAIADCTGHGVPGALMSMLCISSLNEIVNETNLHSPSEILNELRKRIIKSLHQKNSQLNSRDGVDIALIRLDMKEYVMEYAGAYSPVYIAQKVDGEYQLLDLKTDRMPVGIHPRSNIPFENKEMQLQIGDRIYLFSDGITTQFGGEKNSKFTNSRLKRTLANLQHLPMSEHKDQINQVIDEWMDGYQQIDDMMLLGIELTAKFRVNDNLKKILSKRAKRNVLADDSEMNDINEKFAFLLKQLAVLYNEESSTDEILEFLNLVYDEILNSFKVEKRLMIERGSTEIIELEERHQSFIDQISTYKEQVETSVKVLDEMIIYIYDWLAVHF